MNLTFLPSDAVFGPVLDFTADISIADANGSLERGKTYAVMTTETADDIDDVIAAQSDHDANTDFADGPHSSQWTVMLILVLVLI